MTPRTYPPETPCATCEHPRDEHTPEGCDGEGPVDVEGWDEGCDCPEFAQPEKAGPDRDEGE